VVDDAAEDVPAIGAACHGADSTNMGPMRILVLGGTVFLGRALTDAALARRHHVTHLNRGRSAPADPRVATLRADRASDGLATALAAQRWDAVIDTSGYLPQVVARSVRALT